ncbi:TraR/DksA C4-type zinc finger protein [Candidatus Microgenomates bacterium]|nr:TraR/DksA C4-type zinc finger protein [Candidatus Microgenomates bacterium]
MKIVTKNLSVIKKYLEDRRRQIERRLSSIKSEDPFNDTSRLSDNAATDTEAREEVGHERVEAIGNELVNQLANIKRVLSKIGIGKYGYCDNCGHKIEAARLKAFPMAEYCFSCGKKKEKK